MGKGSRGQKPQLAKTLLGKGLKSKGFKGQQLQWARAAVGKSFSGQSAQRAKACGLRLKRAKASMVFVFATKVVTCNFKQQSTPVSSRIPPPLQQQYSCAPSAQNTRSFYDRCFETVFDCLLIEAACLKPGPPLCSGHKALHKAWRKAAHRTQSSEYKVPKALYKSLKP